MDKLPDYARQLKIAVFHNLPSGGGKRRLYELVKRLAPRHEIDLYNMATDCELYMDLRPLAKRTFTFNLRSNLRGGRPYSFLNPLLRFLQIGELLLTEGRIARRMNSRDYDVVFVNSCMFTQTPPLLRYLSKPTVYHCDEPLRRFYEPQLPRPYARGVRARAKGILYLPTNMLTKRMERTSLSFATAVLANSYYSREAMYRIFGSFPRVLQLGVDTDAFRRVAPRERGLVLSVGRIAPHKAYDFLLRCIAAIEPKPRLIIACDTAEPLELDYVRRLARSLCVEVEVKQWVSEPELIQLYSRATVVALPAILEPLGLSALEAMACEAPVVAVREGGFRETIIHGETGFLAERTVESFAGNIQTLLSDASLVEELGLKAREHVRANWSWDASAKALERILLEVAATSDSGR